MPPGFGSDLIGGDGGENDLNGGETESNGFATTNVTNRYAYVWSPVYVDAMVLRDNDATGDDETRRSRR